MKAQVGPEGDNQCPHHLTAALKAACPVCNPDKTVPQLNAAYAAVTSNRERFLEARLGTI